MDVLYFHNAGSSKDSKIKRKGEIRIHELSSKKTPLVFQYCFKTNFISNYSPNSFQARIHHLRYARKPSPLSVNIRLSYLVFPDFLHLIPKHFSGLFAIFTQLHKLKFPALEQNPGYCWTLRIVKIYCFVFLLLIIFIIAPIMYFSVFLLIL